MRITMRVCAEMQIARPIAGIQLYEICCVDLNSLHFMSIFSDSYLSVL